MNYNFTVIEGNIGSGKTSLVKKIAEDFDTNIILEEFEENPFLSSFLENQDKNNLAVELQFLIDRFHQLNKVSGSSKKSIADYFIEKSLIFSNTNLSQMEKDLFDNYFNVLFNRVVKPDLLVYLSVSTERLLQNIEKRGRSYEQKISAEYLEKIHQAYLKHFDSLRTQRVLIIESSNIDFVLNEAHYDKIKELITRPYEIGISTVSIL
jgi:deoxyadenosine/deoxycytidine kinase